LLSLNVHCQKEATNWYFGKYNAMTFTTTPATVFSAGSNSVFGPAGGSISDRQGNLQLYSDGIRIWNRQHQLMDNGMLAGGLSEEQSGLIVKQPGNNSNYFIFYNSHSSSNPNSYSFQYAIADLALASGNGSVTVKNQTLLVPGTEKVCATRHCNGVDVWIITHKGLSDEFHSFLLSTTGLNTVAIISSSGPSYGSVTGSGGGVLKLDPFGNYLADAIQLPQNAFQLYDFNKSTGMVSQPVTIDNTTNVTYCEFSADGGKLYGVGITGTGDPAIIQWNLCAGTGSQVINSSYTVAVGSFSLNQSFGFMQLGPDEKIYISSPQPSLSVIGQPNLNGAGCDFKMLSVPLVSTNAYSLPGFESSLLKPTIHSMTTICSEATFSAPVISCIQSSLITSYYWDFDDPSSGLANNTSTNLNTSHAFETGGTKIIKLVTNNSNCVADTFKQFLVIPTPPTLSVSGRQKICQKESTTLWVSNANTFTWSTSSNSQSITVTPTISTNYSVSATVGSCIATKIISVTVLDCNGFNEVDLSLNISLYPNPATTELHANFSANQNHIRFVIYDALGTPMISDTLNHGQRINIGALSAGLYDVAFFLPGQIITQKFIVTH
jgi:hypothetical protein